jgi:DNA-directed RNA polymerase specialized sigma24 family protein
MSGNENDSKPFDVREMHREREALLDGKTRDEWLQVLPYEDVDNPLARAFVRNQEYMGRIAVTRSGNPDLRDEAPQEIFRRLVDPALESSLPQKVNKERNYLLSASANYANDILRRRKRIPFTPLDEVENLYPVYDEVEEKIDTDLLSQLQKIDPALVHRAKGYSVQEIAALVDASEQAVKTRLYRAREKLRNISPQAKQYDLEVRLSKSMQRMPVEPAFSDEDAKKNKE